ncbi:phage tail tape measure protein [Tissierella sp.]|uniref:phage tail tape measure protein n=1 Tax=Tissierella sp. TaxID=41274 RepID=UPI0028B15EBF|nr:phage tail tape measure protein [Tissierella sp.]
MAKIDLAAYVAKIEADTSGLNTGLDQADGLIKGKIDGMVNWSKVAITGLVAGVVAGIGVTIKKGIDSFIEFENQMNSVYTLLPDITEEAMGKMEQQVKDLSKEMGVLPNELIPALYESLSAGVSDENVFNFLEVAQKGAIAGVTETSTMVDGLTSILNTYQLEATEAGKISDIMFQTIKFGKTSADELANSLYNVIPTASSLGVSFEEVGAGLATITAQGTPTSVATTQMRQMFVELSKESAKTSQLFRELSGQSFKEFIACGGSVQDALKMLEGYAKDNNIAINDLFGSVEAGNAALQLTGGSTELFARNLGEMANSAGATEMAFETMDGGIGRSIEKIKVGMSGMILDLGEKLSPAISNAVDYVLDAMPTIEVVVETTFNVMGEVIKVFIGVIDWLVENLVQFYKDNEEIFNDVAETIKTIFDLIIEVVKMFIFLFRSIWDRYGEYIINYTKTVWEIISTIFQSTLEIIKGILDFFIGLFTGDWERMGHGLVSIASNFWDLIKNVFNLSLEAIKTYLTLAITAFTDLAISIMMGLWEGFRSVWESIIEWFSDIFSALFEWLRSTVSDFFHIGYDMFGNMWDGMKDIWTSMKKWVEDKVSWLKSKLRFWEETERKMSKGGGGSFSAPMPGGSAKAASYDVGTNFVPMDGLAFLHRGEQVIPASMQGKPYNPEPTTEITENHYHISKLEFPNVKDAREIESAISTLSTYAKLWANKI